MLTVPKEAILKAEAKLKEAKEKKRKLKAGLKSASLMSPVKKILKPIYYSVFRWLLLVRCWYSDLRSTQADMGLIPPALLRYRVSESLDIPGFVSIGQACAARIHDGLQSVGGHFHAGQRVLDFGCGCGRTIQWLVDAHRTGEFYGVDVDADAIAWCRENITQAHFQHTNSEPPLPFANEYFDLIYCVSVFTHLDEKSQDAWLHELRRILKVGGILVITVHGERAAFALSNHELDRLHDRGFLHIPTTKLNGIMPEWYNTSWHSHDYVTKRLSGLFNRVRYVVVSDGIQDFVICR